MCWTYLSNKEDANWFPRKLKSAAQQQKKFQQLRELEAEVAATEQGKAKIS